MQYGGILLHPDDNVVVVLARIKAGDTVTIKPGGEKIISRSDLEFGHKLARHDLKQGQKIIKYGHPIGKSLEDIPGGAHVHVHNVVGLRVDSGKEAGR